MWTAAGVQGSALAALIINREDVDTETLREKWGKEGVCCDLTGPIRAQVEWRPHAV